MRHDEHHNELMSLTLYITMGGRSADQIAIRMNNQL